MGTEDSQRVPNLENRLNFLTVRNSNLLHFPMPNQYRNTGFDSPMFPFSWRSRYSDYSLVTVIISSNYQLREHSSPKPFIRYELSGRWRANEFYYLLRVFIKPWGSVISMVINWRILLVAFFSWWSTHCWEILFCFWFWSPWTKLSHTNFFMQNISNLF